MIDVSWLDEAMDEAGFKYNKDLAEEAGVSPATVGNALKKGTVRESTARKLQDACGEHAIGPYMDTEYVSGKDAEDSVFNPPELDDESCLERFRGTDCPTTSAECTACWDALKDLIPINEMPFNRGVCRLEHGWKMKKGYLVYVSPEGEEIEAWELNRHREGS